MDILLGVIGAVIVILLVIVIVLIVRKSGNKGESADYKAMEERLIRMEGEIAKINPEIDRNFRENRKAMKRVWNCLGPEMRRSWSK